MFGVSIHLFDGALREVLGERVGALPCAERSIESLRIAWKHVCGTKVITTLITFVPSTEDVLTLVIQRVGLRV